MDNKRGFKRYTRMLHKSSSVQYSSSPEQKVMRETTISSLYHSRYKHCSKSSCSASLIDFQTALACLPQTSPVLNTIHQVLGITVYFEAFFDKMTVRSKCVIKKLNVALKLFQLYSHSGLGNELNNSCKFQNAFNHIVIHITLMLIHMQMK